MIYQKPEMNIIFCEQTDVIRTSLSSGTGGGPNITVPGGGLLPGEGGGSSIPSPVGNWI